MNIIVSILIFICASSFVSCDTECPSVNSSFDNRMNTNKLRIMQYNVEWLFLDYSSSSDCPGYGCTWHTESDAQTHFGYVSNIVNTLDPDIVSFCEVEGCDELKVLASTLSETYTPYLKKGTDTGTGQNVGILTKVSPLVSLYRTEDRVNYPIEGSTCEYEGAAGSSGVSKHYITEFNVSSLKVAMIGVHLIAVPTDPVRCAQREAQATVIQNVVSSYVNKGYEIILIGDMNDYDGEVLDVNSNKPISRTLDILKGEGSDYKLTNVAYRINKIERFSEWWDSDSDCDTDSPDDISMIDHVLVTENINKIIYNVFIYHGYNEYCGKWNSDHWPVVIDLKV